MVVYENSSDEFDTGIAQSRSWSQHNLKLFLDIYYLPFFSIYHNTNCQVLYISFGTIMEAVIKYVCSSDNYTTFMNMVTCE